MDCSIAHAPKGISFVIMPKEKGKFEVLRFKLGENMLRLPKMGKDGQPKPDKLAFVASLQPGDRLFLEMGGAGDRVALAAIAFGATVYRYPGFMLGKEDVQRILSEHGIKMPEERSEGDETSPELTARKARAVALYLLGQERPDEFYVPNDVDLSVLQLGHEYKAYRRMQKAYQRALLGLLAAFRDQAFLILAENRQMEAKAKDQFVVYNAVLEAVITDIIGGKISKAKKNDFFALVGKAFKGRTPNLSTAGDLKILAKVLVDSDELGATVCRRMKEQVKKMEKLLEPQKQRVPGQKNQWSVVPGHVFWEKVFSQIPGMGPVTTARFIAGIADIRRFPSEAHLKAYAGYSHNLDGSIHKRVKGKAYNVCQDLKQATYQWSDATVKLPDSPWRAKLDARKAFELWKLLAERQAEALTLGVTVAIMPPAFAGRQFTTMLEMNASDYALLGAHVDVLRKLAGLDTQPDDEDDEDTEEAIEEAAVVKDPQLAKLVRGVKGHAHKRGLRWLGQKILEHLFRKMRAAIGLSERVENIRKVA